MRRRDLIIGGTAAAGVTAAGLTYWSERRSTGTVAMAKSGPRHFRSAGGVVDVELTAARARFTLGGREAIGMAFNGEVPGPMIEARPGDTVRLKFHNALDDPTNLHYHGLHVSPSGRADNIFLSVPPGESLNYEFRIPKDHPAGLFWYHPHLHGLVADHLSQGLAGLFVIRGELDRIPEIAAAIERFLVLQDWDLGQDGRVLGASMRERMMMGREGALITVTAEATPVLEVPAGGLLRLRWLNASSSRFYLLGTDGPPLHVAATDGGGLPALRSVDRLLLAPGERADVLVQGEMSIRNFDYGRGSMGMMGMMGGGGMGGMRGGGMAPPTGGGTGEQVLLRVRSIASATKPVPLPKSLVRLDPLPAPSATRSFTLGMRMGMGMMRGGSEMFTINGKGFDHNRIDTAVHLGTVEDWEYVNETTMDHPMHLHVNPFQLIGADGQVERAWRDVIVVKAQARARFRIAFRDFPGKTVQHCHILDHEDMGMMATVEMRG